MPRQAHGRPLLKAGSSNLAKRKPQRNAVLNALETAERQNPDSIKIRQHRLGEVYDDSDVIRTHADADGRSNKRRKINVEREDEEDVEEGSDLEGGTWHTGVNEDDEDSDLDSDEAFGESDEEKFADFTFRGSGTRPSADKQPKVRKVKEVNLNEDVDDGSEDENDVRDSESDELGDEAVDLATAWDMNSADEREGRKSTAKKSKAKRKAHSESGDSDEVSEDEDEDEDSEDEAQDDESQFSISDGELEGDTDGLRSFVEGLSTSAVEQKQQTRSAFGSLPSQPSRFGLPPSKLSATDLLQYVKDPAQRQSLKILQNAERSGPEEYKGGIPGKLSVPLAKRQQDRLDRGAAYDKAKETLNRWIDTVKKNRRAEHLSFPLADQAKESALGQKQLIPTSQSAPATGLEAAIQQIMQESGMGQKAGQSTEEQEQAFEELAERKMDIDEVKARRTELRMARELMFREEVRAKRIKKIKSKAYRRVHRKQRDRIEAQQREALEAAGLLDSEEERERQDRRRAEERMGARHRESKWAKGIKQAGRAVWDDSARAGVSDLARRDEELRRRIEGKDVADPEISGAESDSESDYSVDTENEDQRLTEKLNGLDSASNIDSKSKLGQMAFMQRADAARKAVNDEELRQLRLALDDKKDGVAVDEDEYQEPTGRQKFGVRTESKPVIQHRRKKNEFEARLSEDEDENDHVVLPVEQIETKATGFAALDQSRIPPGAKADNGGNGKRTTRESSGKQQNLVKAKQVNTQELHDRDTTLDGYTSPSESEDDATNHLNSDQAKAALAASIFAGPDDAVQDFAKEKAQLVEEEGDQVIDNTLPGWGSWTGAGVSKREQKKAKGRFLTTVKGIAPEKRKDAKLDRVIVNEKQVKKNGKYLATELPHPFETRQQYERSLRLPVGPEWSTTNHYQDSIKPRVLLKQGTVVKPIAKPIF